MYDYDYDLLADALTGDGITVLRNEPLSVHSSFRIGGTCALAVFPADTESLLRAYERLTAAAVPIFLAGNGTNLLFPDGGFPGAVVFTEKMNRIAFCDGYVTAQAGASLTGLCAQAGKKRGYAGFSFGYGIPGSVGGGVYMNAGAYGGQVSDLLLRSVYYDIGTGKVETLPAAEHHFSYRHSAYRTHPEWVLLSANFACVPGDRDEIVAQCNANMTARREKQPLEYPNAGSTFKRPQGYFAGKLIEDAGLKGAAIGGAQVSEKHAGFIVNRGGASAADVRALIAYVQERVFAQAGVRLECEIIMPEEPDVQNVQ